MSSNPPIERFAQAKMILNEIFRDLVKLLEDTDGFVKGMLDSDYSNADMLEFV